MFLTHLCLEYSDAYRSKKAEMELKRVMLENMLVETKFGCLTSCLDLCGCGNDNNNHHMPPREEETKPKGSTNTLKLNAQRMIFPKNGRGRDNDDESCMTDDTDESEDSSKWSEESEEAVVVVRRRASAMNTANNREKKAPDNLLSTLRGANSSMALNVPSGNEERKQAVAEVAAIRKREAKAEEKRKQKEEAKKKADEMKRQRLIQKQQEEEMRRMALIVEEEMRRMALIQEQHDERERIDRLRRHQEEVKRQQELGTVPSLMDDESKSSATKRQKAAPAIGLRRSGSKIEVPKSIPANTRQAQSKSDDGLCNRHDEQTHYMLPPPPPPSHKSPVTPQRTRPFSPITEIPPLLKPIVRMFFDDDGVSSQSSQSSGSVETEETGVDERREESEMSAKKGSERRDTTELHSQTISTVATATAAAAVAKSSPTKRPNIPLAIGLRSGSKNEAAKPISANTRQAQSKSAPPATQSSRPPGPVSEKPSLLHSFVRMFFDDDDVSSQSSGSVDTYETFEDERRDGQRKNMSKEKKATQRTDSDSTEHEHSQMVSAAATAAAAAVAIPLAIPAVAAAAVFTGLSYAKQSFMEQDYEWDDGEDDAVKNAPEPKPSPIDPLLDTIRSVNDTNPNQVRIHKEATVGEARKNAPKSKEKQKTNEKHKDATVREANKAKTQRAQIQRRERLAREREEAERKHLEQHQLLVKQREEAERKQLDQQLLAKQREKEEARRLAEAKSKEKQKTDEKYIHLPKSNQPQANGGDSLLQMLRSENSSDPSQQQQAEMEKEPKMRDQILADEKRKEEQTRRWADTKAKSQRAQIQRREKLARQREEAERKHVEEQQLLVKQREKAERKQLEQQLLAKQRKEEEARRLAEAKAAQERQHREDEERRRIEELQRKKSEEEERRRKAEEERSLKRQQIRTKSNEAHDSLLHTIRSVNSPVLSQILDHQQEELKRKMMQQAEDEQKRKEDEARRWNDAKQTAKLLEENREQAEAEKKKADLLELVQSHLRKDGAYSEATSLLAQEVLAKRLERRQEELSKKNASKSISWSSSDDKQGLGNSGSCKSTPVVRSSGNAAVDAAITKTQSHPPPRSQPSTAKPALTKDAMKSASSSKQSRPSIILGGAKSSKASKEGPKQKSNKPTFTTSNRQAKRSSLLNSRASKKSSSDRYSDFPDVF